MGPFSGQWFGFVCEDRSVLDLVSAALTKQLGLSIADLGEFQVDGKQGFCFEAANSRASDLDAGAPSQEGFIEHIATIVEQFPVRQYLQDSDSNNYVEVENAGSLLGSFRMEDEEQQFLG